jgi:cysteine desulfurase
MSDTVTKTIYLDHAATTPLDQTVYETMLSHLQENYGNPSSIHRVGRAAFDALQKARASLAHSLDVNETEIILTGSGTESDNLAILGLARAHRTHGNHVVVSAIEHHAILQSAHALEKEGFRVTYLPVDEAGLVRLDELKKALTDDTILVSIMYANNEIGTIEPLHEIRDLLKTHYASDHVPVFHTDACQAVGLLPVQPRELGVDAMTINSSKIYGPKGIGLLYLRNGVEIEPVVVGGHQESGRRAGTENVALAVGFAMALKRAVANEIAEACRLAALRDHLLQELRTHIPSLLLNGHPTKRLANNIHICIPDVEGEAMLLMLDAAGICAATGSACNASDLEPSHVLTAIGRDEDIIHGSLRFTLGRSTTAEDLTYTAKILDDTVNKLRAMSTTPIISSLAHVKHS